MTGAAAPGESDWGTREWAALGLALALYLMVVRPFYGLFADDAYISLRYALNWAGGCGPRYNCGETPVEGYTNFLWVAIAAAALRVGLDAVALIRWLGLLAGFATVALAALLCSRLHRSRLALAAPLVGIAASPFFAVNAVSGLETAAATASVLGAALLSLELPERRRPWLAGLAWGASYLVRPDALLFAALTALYSLAAGLGRRLPLRVTLRGTASFGAGFFALCAPHCLWRWRYYGELIPNTYYAKELPLEELLRVNLRLVGEHALFFVAVALAALVALALARRAALGYLLTLALASFAVSLSVSNNGWMPGHRLQLTAVALLVVGGAGLADAVRGGGGGRRRALAAAVALAFPAVLLACAWRDLPGTLRLAEHSYARDHAPARLMGERIRSAARPGEWLAIRDAGMVPYYAGSAVKVLDMHERSLNDRYITRRGWELLYVLARDLRFVVLVSFDHRGLILAHPVEYEIVSSRDFFGRYRQRMVIPWHPQRHFYLFERVGR
jgi:hypothetical protein